MGIQGSTLCYLNIGIFKKKKLPLFMHQNPCDILYATGEKTLKNTLVPATLQNKLAKVRQSLRPRPKAATNVPPPRCKCCDNIASNTLSFTSQATKENFIIKSHLDCNIVNMSAAVVYNTQAGQY